MKLTCPSCGAVASAEAWDNDTRWRELLQVVSSLPAPIPTVVLGYLSLFRPAKSALSVKKALRLAKEINELATPGHIQVQGKVARPCPARIWRLGMEQMVERRPSLTLPLKSHNYLRQIVYQLADQEDSQREQQTRHNEQTGSGIRGHVTSTCPRNPEPDDGLLPIERKMRERGMEVPELKGMK